MTSCPGRNGGGHTRHPGRPGQALLPFAPTAQNEEADDVHPDEPPDRALTIILWPEKQQQFF